MFKPNNKNTKQRPWRLSFVSIVNFEHLFLVLFVVDFEQVNASWVTVREKLFALLNSKFTK